ncbi:MAG TPA: hypothetical protein VNJ04_06595 [Gemmatimonadaceae bacterium]|nr:hypothetical protein [Gemmatimonadaceae bacterium]
MKAYLVSEHARASGALGGFASAAARGEVLSPVTSALSIFREGALAARALGKNVLVRAGGRNRERVAREYDGTIWKSILEKRRWETAGSVHDYVVFQDQESLVAKVEGKIVRISTADYYEFRLAKLQEVMTLHAGDTDTIIEIGSGWGHNLFSLALANRWKSLKGFEISLNGVRATNQAAAHFGVKSVTAGQCDLTARGDQAFGEMNRATVFSYLCLEQLKHATAVVIENLLAANVRRVIHIEPVPEILSWWRLGDAANKLYIAAQDYQNNLLSTLRSFERAGRLRVIHVSRLSFAPRPISDPVLICWETA